MGGKQTDSRFFRAALDELPDALIGLDSDERIVFWSRRAEELLGWPESQVLGKCVDACFLPEGIATDLHAKRTIRCRVRRHNGDTFDAELRIAATQIGRRRFRIITLRDVSDQLFAEQQLVQAQKLEAIGHLTGGLAHDFNNLLGIIIGSLDLVAPSVTDPMESELMAAAQSAAHRGADITRALLAVARRRALKPQPTNVNVLIDELVPLLRQTAGKRADVIFSANALDAVCNIDAGGLNNALVNLVINARDATEGAGTILIYTYTTDILPQALMSPLELEPGPYLVVGVDDSGCGMSPEVAMKAFDPFFTTKDRGRGTGLGLAMVYGFARQCGGTARIQSAPGRGTSVQLLLPIVPKQVGIDTASTVTAAAGLTGGNARLLLVDDEPVLLTVASEWLRSLGYAVTTAKNADEALEKLVESRFDLLVSDIVMPGSIDGLALVERCRGLYPEMPALVTTGFADGQAAVLRTRAPVLDKPYTRTTLGQAVAEALQASL